MSIAVKQKGPSLEMIKRMCTNYLTAMSKILQIYETNDLTAFIVHTMFSKTKTVYKWSMS